jgi:hypothetical protein
MFIKIKEHVPVPNVQSMTPDDGQKNCPNCHNKKWNLMRLLVFIVKL